MSVNEILIKETYDKQFMTNCNTQVLILTKKGFYKKSIHYIMIC